MNNARQKTISDIVAWLRRPRDGEKNYLTLERDEIADLIEAAHNHEVTELRKCLKIAEDALTELQTRLTASVYDGTMNPYEALDITERALHAIREKGVNNGK